MQKLIAPSGKPQILRANTQNAKNLEQLMEITKVNHMLEKIKDLPPLELHEHLREIIT